ncbi:hypothetical protein BDZ89DRAFT_1156203 [Hymenopellis radicata]|nr:hypothetical protein BDZ89DRAFT_1156203 [Hymenopellis radicata]
MDKPPKRKRLAKACDGCHKSKRRCDGTDPCSNCYFASKPCTYTDSTGRPVPPPRLPDPQPQPQPQPQPASSQPSYQFPQSQPQSSYAASSARKRSHSECDPETLDPLLTRELTNLFFAHSHPVVSIIHKPTFTAALSHNQVPRYLVNAVSAIAARHSKQPSLQVKPARCAGRRFQDAAIALMFDSSGRLTAPANLQTAQALCLLSTYEIVAHDDYKFDKNGKDKSHSGWISGERFRALTLQLIESMNVHTPENPLLSSTPSSAMVTETLERECIRRIFWLVYVVDCVRGVWFGWTGGGMSHSSPSTEGLSIGGGVMGFSEAELHLRLPADETSFEMGVVHQSLPEYLYLPAVRTHYASEFGHLVRVITIHQKVESALDVLARPETKKVVADCERLLEEWSCSLPPHLLFSKQCVSVQKSMFETSSNLGAWCYALIHIYHATSSLALIVARQRLAEQSRTIYNIPDLDFIMERIYSIMNMLGSRAKYSFIQGSVLWPLIKYLDMAKDPQVMLWLEDYEDLAGVRMERLVRDRWGDPQGPSSLCLRHTTPTLPPRPSQPDRSDTSIDPALVTPKEKSFHFAPPLSNGSDKLLPSLKSSGLLEWSNPAPTNLPPFGLQTERRGPIASSDSGRSLPLSLSWLANDSRD